MQKLASGIRDRFGKLREMAVGSYHGAAWIWQGPVRWLVLCGAVLIAAIIVGTVATVGQFRESAIRNSERELENTVMLLTRHFDQQLGDSDIIAGNLISQMQISGMASPEIFRSRLSSPEAHMELKSKVSTLSYVGDVNIFDADGVLINSSGAWPHPATNIADRAYFNTLKSDPPSKKSVIELVRSHSTGNWAMIISRRLSGPDGTFLGVMTRRTDPANIEKFFASIALGKDAAISM